MQALRIRTTSGISHVHIITFRPRARSLVYTVDFSEIEHFKRNMMLKMYTRKLKEDVINKKRNFQGNYQKQEITIMATKKD